MDGKVCTTFLLRSYCVLTASILHQLRNHHDHFTFLPRQRYVHTTMYKTTLPLFHVRPVLNTSVVCLYQVLIASMARQAIKFKYFTKILTFSLVFQLLSWKQKIRTFFCNVLCIRAAKLCLRRRLPLCCYGGYNEEGIGDNLDLVGCALGFRMPLPYRQHQHKHRGQVLNCHPFYGRFVLSSYLLEA